MTAFWIIGAIVSYIGIGLCVSAWNIRTSGSSEWCEWVALLWPLYCVLWVVALVRFATKWVVLRLAGKSSSWKEFMDDYWKEFMDD